MEDLGEEKSGGKGAEDDAFGPNGGEAGVVIRVEVWEKVGDGEIGIREVEGVNEETSVPKPISTRQQLNLSLPNQIKFNPKLEELQPWWLCLSREREVEERGRLLEKSERG